MKYVFASLMLSFAMLWSVPASAASCGFFRYAEYCLGRDLGSGIDMSYPRDPYDFLPFARVGNGIDPNSFDFLLIDNDCDDICYVFDFSLDFNRNAVSSSLDRLEIGDTFSSLYFIVDAAPETGRIEIDTQYLGIQDFHRITLPARRLYFDFGLSETATLEERFDNSTLLLAAFASSSSGMNNRVIFSDGLPVSAEIRRFVAPVPLPGGMALIGLAIGGLLMAGRRQWSRPG